MLGVQWVITGMLQREIRAWASIARARDQKDKGLIRLIHLFIFGCVGKERNRRAFEGEEIQDTICVEIRVKLKSKIN